MLGVKVAFNNKIPKATQIISLLLTISNQQGVILEVKTGEGKTMIIAMVALYYALLNKKVDIITSS
jgi:preprotein translocase subunit SecA